MATQMTSKLRNDIASLSTGGVGTHYTHTGGFFTRLDRVLWDNGLRVTTQEQGLPGMSCLEYPIIHTPEGRGRIEVTTTGGEMPLFDIVYTWYRMPSGNWEFICYPTC